MKGIINKNWADLVKTCDWVADMEGVLQSPIHHAEGDVATHTQMVLAALIALPEYALLDNNEREILWLAALLHDVEKRSTTFQEADGSIVSPGHAKKGALTARHILFTEFALSFEVREQIVNLVRYHGLPIWLMYKPDPMKSLLEASLVVNTQLLAMLAKADMLGRICIDKNEMLYRVTFFEAYCKEQDCWGKPYRFVNDLARFYYFSKSSSTPEYVPFDDTICDVVVMSGLPGMGKDNYISKNYKDWPVVSLDDIRRKHKLKPEDKSANGWVAQYAKEQARIHLRAKQNFVWNATNITLQMRSQLIALLISYNAKVTIIYLERPFKVWHKQNAARTTMVPHNVLSKMLHKLEVPKPSEAHKVLYEVG